MLSWKNVPGDCTMIYVDVDTSLLPDPPRFYKYNYKLIESDIITIKPRKRRLFRRKTTISLTFQPCGKTEKCP